MDQVRLRNFAKLIARKGVNVQQGQQVVIQAELDQPDFVALLVEECYLAGAEKVTVDWSHQALERLHVTYCTDETLARFEEWEKAKMQHYVDHLPARIWLLSDDPDGLNGVDQAKYAKGAQARRSAMKPYRDQMENRYQWCIAAVPGLAWAKKLFPQLPDNEAMEALWEAILSASRVTDDPIAAWDAHNADLAGRCQRLNELDITELHYRSQNGTDLRVGMIPQAEFKGGCDTDLNGVVFNANIPSEECFISPMKGKAEGIVYSAMPLSYQGQLIDNFWLRFEGGKVVELGAEQNESLLRTLVESDENACYLGECALVPYDSPIRNAGLLFYNTLFDENAACHLALGAGYADTIKDFEKYTLAECRAMGINDSIIHEDFMIGSEDLDIDAICADGSVVPIFRHGNWAF